VHLQDLHESFFRRHLHGVSLFSLPASQML